MLKSISAKIKIETRSREEAEILHLSVNPDNLIRPEDLIINQKVKENKIVFDVHSVVPNLLRVSSTIDDFLFSLCLAAKILNILITKETKSST